MLIFGVPNPDGLNEIRLLNGLLPLEPSLKYLSYGVNQFCWGYGGAGPSQLAFALILHFCSAEDAFLYHNSFKWDVLANIPTQDLLSLESEDIQTYVAWKKGQQSKLGRLYWKFFAHRRFSSIFYYRFIFPLELKVKEPGTTLPEEEFYKPGFFGFPSY